MQATTTRPLKLDPVRPEYHRATLHWRAGADGAHGAHVKPVACATSPMQRTMNCTTIADKATRHPVEVPAPAALIAFVLWLLQPRPYHRHLMIRAGTWVAESTGGQLSSRLLSMRSASALLELPKVDSQHLG